MSSVKMIGTAEHCDLSSDWIIKAVFLRRSLHRLWHSAASVTQDKLLLRLDCTLHQWRNYEIDVVLIQISIWKPIIDRYCRLGGSSRRADRMICSAGADDEFGLKHMWFLTHDHAEPTLIVIVAGQPFQSSLQIWGMIIYPPVLVGHLDHDHLWAEVVDIYHLLQWHYGVWKDSSSSRK